MQKINKVLTLLQHLLPAIIWGIGIFVVISIPGNTFQKSRLLKIEHIDKAIHFVMFFGFSFLLCMGLFRQQVIHYLYKHYLTYTFFFSILYGAVTELFQSILFVSRSGNIWDFFANTTGTIAGVIVFSRLFKDRLLKKSNIAD